MNTNKTNEREAYRLVPFTYENHAVRTVMIDGAPWFVAKDVCDALALGNPSQTLAGFPETETAIISNDSRSTSGVEQKRKMLVVNEPGLYRLIFQSRKPEAERFKTWVFAEVLPAIRRNGTYQTPEQGELFAKLQQMGSPHEVMTCALMGRIYQRAGACRMDIQQMYHIMELALAKSELTGEYLMAKDVARAVRGEGLATYSLIEHYVIEIRAIVAEYGFVPHMVRLINGNYKPVEESPLKPRRKEAAAINAKIKAGLALTKKPVSTKQQEALFVPDAAANPPSKEGEAK